VLPRREPAALAAVSVALRPDCRPVSCHDRFLSLLSTGLGELVEVLGCIQVGEPVAARRPAPPPAAVTPGRTIGAQIVGRYSPQAWAMLAAEFPMPDRAHAGRPWAIAFGAPAGLPPLRHVLLGMNAKAIPRRACRIGMPTEAVGMCDIVRAECPFRLLPVHRRQRLASPSFKARGFINGVEYLVDMRNPTSSPLYTSTHLDAGTMRTHAAVCPAHAKRRKQPMILRLASARTRQVSRAPARRWIPARVRTTTLFGARFARDERCSAKRHRTCA
jgi:hypothetical protein